MSLSYLSERALLNPNVEPRYLYPSGADDSAQLQAALDEECAKTYPRPIVLGPGNFLLSAPLAMPKKGTRLSGAGMHRTWLSYTGGALASGLMEFTGTGSASWTIEALSLIPTANLDYGTTGTTSYLTMRAVRVTVCALAGFAHSSIVGSYHGLQSNGPPIGFDIKNDGLGNGIEISSCTFVNGKIGIRATNTTALCISNACVFEALTECGISLVSTAGTVITGCYFEGNGSDTYLDGNHVSDVVLNGDLSFANDSRSFLNEGFTATGNYHNQHATATCTYFANAVDGATIKDNYINGSAPEIGINWSAAKGRLHHADLQSAPVHDPAHVYATSGNESTFHVMFGTKWYAERYNLIADPDLTNASSWPKVLGPTPAPGFSSGTGPGAIAGFTPLTTDSIYGHTVDCTQYRGKQLIFECWIKNAAGGNNVVLYTDVAGYDSSSHWNSNGEWQKRRMIIQVPAAATNIIFGLRYIGTGIVTITAPRLWEAGFEDQLLA